MARRSLALGDELGERKHRPAIARPIVGGELVVVLEQISEGPEIDHRVKSPTDSVSE